MSSTAWNICDFEGVPRMSLDFGGHLGAEGKGPPPLKFCAGDGLGRRALSNFRVKSLRNCKNLLSGLPVSSRAFFGSFLPTRRFLPPCLLGGFSPPCLLEGLKPILGLGRV